MSAIWDSIVAMTIIDILIVVGVCVSIKSHYAHRTRLVAAGSARGTIAVLFGLSMIALFFLADLVTMHVYPLFASYADAMQAMEFLHLNISWLMFALAITFLVAGMVSINRANAALVDDLRKSRADLADKLGQHRQDNVALRESEERFALVVRGTNDGIWDWNLQTNEDYFSPRWKEILGYGDDELQPHIGTFGDLLHPDDQERVWDAVDDHLKDHLKKGTPYDLEFRLRHKAGHYVRVRATGQAIWDDNGQPRRMAGSISDVTGSKRIEQALRESESSLANAQRIARLGNWDWDIVKNTLSWSDEIYRIFGLMPRQFDANYEAFLNSVHPDDRETVQSAVAAALHDRTPYSIEHRIVLPNDDIRFVHERGEVTFDGDGTPLRMTGTVHDITDRKQAEAHLVQVQKMDSIALLTGGVAHDFNNLLTVVLGNLELILKRAEDSDIRKFAGRALKSSLHGADLTQQLLAYSRQQVLVPKIVDCNDNVAGLAGTMRRSLGANIEVRTKTDDGLWNCEVDAGQLESAMLNIAINARDAMPSGGILTIRTDNTRVVDNDSLRQTELPPGEYVRITIADTGHGMPRHVLDRATEPFFTTKEIGQGSGLGLSMAYGFIRQSGGQILIESEKGAGTTVSLFLPRVPGIHRSAPAGGDELIPASRGESILVVEDDPDVRALTGMVLGDLGYTVVSAGDGEEALRILHDRAEIDLLLTDIELPGGISGIDIARQATIRIPDIKILFMSGYTDQMPDDSDAYGKTVHFIAKPFKWTDIARALSVALQGSGAALSP